MTSSFILLSQTRMEALVALILCIVGGIIFMNLSINDKDKSIPKAKPKPKSLKPETDDSIASDPLTMFGVSFVLLFLFIILGVIITWLIDK